MTTKAAHSALRARRTSGDTTDQTRGMHAWAAIVAGIPSPGTGVLELGPLRLNAYGMMIALGAIAATYVTGRRLERAGVGTREDATSIAMIAVPAGVIGGRLYHVATDWERFADRPLRIVQIWRGGLGIWGGIALGVVVGLLVARRRGLPVLATLTAATPGLPVAQAIGRWGNWFNQELYGRATTLPWGLEIDERHLPAGAAPGTLFHPTFLYESLWCLVLAGLLLVVDRRVRLAPGRLFLVYVAGYCAMRFFIEGLRIDPAKAAGGLRLNQWVSLALLAVAVVGLARRGARITRSPGGDPGEGSPRPGG
jgi:prolipoprotein diacylglyceryl transferase